MAAEELLRANFLIDAVRCAAAAHGDQRYGDQPYITHPLAVAALVDFYDGDPHQVVAAVLHDVIEDTDETYDSVLVRFGLPVASIVEAVTKVDGETQEAYLARIVATTGAPLVKACDSFSNWAGLSAANMDPQRREKLERRYLGNLNALKPYLPTSFQLVIGSLG